MRGIRLLHCGLQLQWPLHRFRTPIEQSVNEAEGRLLEFWSRIAYNLIVIRIGIDSA